jgi:membrane protease YdiL (CAAX protease family)
MTPLSQLNAVEYGLESTVPVTVSQTAPGMRSLFVEPRGLRAGWRLLIFLGLLAVLFGGIALVRTGGPQGLREAQKHLSNVTVTPFKLGASEAIVFALLCLATLVVGRLEHRKFSEYGLPLCQALGKDFWIGCLSGFLAISGTLLAMFMLHGFRITSFALHGKAILYALTGWAIAFLMVGLCEEFLNRGYLQYTLACGIGFWPAAFVMSGFFAFGHACNPHETLAGVASVVLFGLLLCLFLRRSGNLWCAVGFHAAYDWGQTLFGVPDSGIAPYHNLFNSVFSGPRWLTGGSVGPEASVLTPIALALVALLFSRYYRENRYPVQRLRTM